MTLGRRLERSVDCFEYPRTPATHGNCSVLLIKVYAILILHSEACVEGDEEALNPGKLDTVPQY